MDARVAIARNGLPPLRVSSSERNVREVHPTLRSERTTARRSERPRPDTRVNPRRTRSIGEPSTIRGTKASCSAARPSRKSCIPKKNLGQLDRLSRYTGRHTEGLIVNTMNSIKSLQTACMHPDSASQGASNEYKHGWSRPRPTAKSHSPRRTLWVLAAIVLAGTVAPQALGQVCKVTYETVNKDRYVYGRIDNECSGFHTKPFGNWGVDTEASNRVDGRQFEGWCHFRHACDRDGNCKWHCRDSWYEWNSCRKAVVSRSNDSHRPRAGDSLPISCFLTSRTDPENRRAAT